MRGRPLHVKWQEDEATLYRRYKREKDPQNRTRLQALWLIRKGYPIKKAAEVVGVHRSTVQKWIAWYRQGGVAEVLRHRHGGHGGPRRKLTPQQEEALKREAAQGRFRTLWEAVEWVEQQFGVKYTYWGMQWVFRRLGLRPKVPRPVAPQASLKGQEEWKKGGLRNS